MWRVYIAGPYSGKHLADDKDDSHQQISENIAKARQASIQLAELGFAWFCPHLNSEHFEVDCKLPHTYESYLPPDFTWIEACDALYLLPGWEKSHGTGQEVAYAKSLGIPVFTSLTELDNHFTKLDGFITDKTYLQTQRETGERRFRLWYKNYEEIFDGYITKKSGVI